MGFAFWLLVAAAMAVVEAVSFGLITVWFVVGALAAFIAAFCGAGITLQVVVFLAVSVLCLLLLRPFALKHRNAGAAAEPSLIGQQAVVVEPIDNAAAAGRVQTDDHMTWAARSADGLPLATGQEVTVVGQESIKLIVERKQV